MTFQTYPHDTQNCAMKIESLSHTTADLVFTWEPEVPLEVDESIELPQLDLVSNTTGDCTQVYSTGECTYSTGNFTCLEVSFTFKRRLGYYLFHTYVPTCLIVIMSWISFWIKPEAVPARVTLGVTSLLTLSTQHANSQKSLPPVSYIKAIDMFMSSCTVFVFLSLMEYAVVNVILGDMVERRNQESLMKKVTRKLVGKKARAKKAAEKHREDLTAECGHCCCQENHDCIPESDIIGQESITIDPTPTPLTLRDESRRGRETGVVVALSGLTESARPPRNSVMVNSKPDAGGTTKPALDGSVTVCHVPHRGASSSIPRSNFPRELHHNLHSRVLQGGLPQQELGSRQCLHTCPLTKTRQHINELQRAKQESQSSIPSLAFYQNLQSNGNESTSNLSRTFLLEMRDARAKAILVDRFSRVFFPLSFAILNILYWCVYFEW
ncbi:Neurotransmitter-gated ion-channel ligand-binding domain [Trinorchestia longiramus]|nr:Neurotransmitter-gated ion-channel ligand-binding domain [Trinorchestia longiramus]